MKKVAMIALAAMCAMAVGCSKDKRCKCAPVEDDGLLRILEVDNSMNCKDIKGTMVEEKRVVDGEQTLVRLDTIVFNCRDYAE